MGTLGVNAHESRQGMSTLHPESSTYANEQVVMRGIPYPSLHVPFVSCTHAYHYL